MIPKLLILCQCYFGTMSALPHISSKGTETLASIIQKAAEVLDLLGDVKVIKRTIISNSIVKEKCKADIKFETKEKSVIFQPLVEETLEFREFYETIRKGGIFFKGGIF